MKKYIFGLFSLVFLFTVNTSIGQQKTVSTGLEVLTDIGDITSKAAEIAKKIDTAFAKVTKNNSYRTIVDGNLQLPFGILPDNGNSDYALVVNAINMDAVVGMTAEMYMKIPKGEGKYLYFLADKVPLSKSGKMLGDMNLFLMKTDTSSVGKGYDIEFKGLDNKAKAYSYITFDCKGFKEILINGGLILNTDAVIEHTDDNSATSTDTKSTDTTKSDLAVKPVKLDFFVNADRLENIVVEFSNVPTLEFKKLPGFKVTVPRLVFDKSENRNSPKFKLPSWYLDSLQKKAGEEGDFDRELYTSPLWEGLYIPSATIEIPRAFTEGEDGTSQDTVVIVSKDIIIDQWGVTALTRADSKQDSGIVNGNIKGFKYRLDSLELNVIASTLSKAAMYGETSLPICKDDSYLQLGIVITQSVKEDSELQYNGSAKTNKPLNVKAFGLAQLNSKTTEYRLEYSNKQFYPSVVLNGSLVLLPKKKEGTEASGSMTLLMSNLLVTSKAPYVTILKDGFVKLDSLSESKMGNLPISISAPPEIVNKGQRFGLKMGLKVAFQKSKGNTKKSGNGFSGDARFTIWAERNPSTKNWAYDGFDMDSIGIMMAGNGFDMQGSLQMFDNHPIYGKGYCGMIDIKLIKKLQIQGAVMFGKVTDQTFDADSILEIMEAGGKIEILPEVEGEDVIAGDKDFYRYWFVDMKVSFSPAIPVFTGVEFNSFTGGLYHNMVMSKETAEEGKDGKEPKVLCNTASGRRFIPEEGTLGLLAGVGIQSPGGGATYHGDINFGLEFGIPDGGLRRVTTWGGVSFMKGEVPTGNLQALADKMDSTPMNEIKKREIKEKKNPPSPDEKVCVNWFVEYDVPNETLVGDFDIFVNVNGVITGRGAENNAGHMAIYSSPNEWYIYIGEPSNAKMVGLTVMNLADIGGYMCIGSVLPNPPIAPMPPGVAPDLNIDYSLLNVGGGISFGARLNIDGHPGVDLGVCNARVELVFFIKSGFDLLLSKANEPIYCNGNERGINDWYATGQAYLYGGAALQASWGCTLFPKGSKELLSMYLKAYVFAQLPKPTYFKGRVEFGFKIVGETFTKSFKLEKGDMCNSNTLESEVNFISGIDPTNEQKDVPVGSKINIYFSERLMNFEYKILNDNNNEGTYRAYTDEDHVKVTIDGVRVEYHSEFNESFTQLTVSPIRVFEGNKDIKVEVTVITQIKNGDDWEDTEKTETKDVVFTTADEKEYIPLPDIHYAYPYPNMKNFYKLETTKGFVRLSTLPNKAIELPENYEYVIAFYEGKNEIDRNNSVEYIANFGENNFEFRLPNSRLETNKTYTMKIMKSVKPTFTNEGSTTEGNTTTGTIAIDYPNFVILEYNFTTSKYTTFEAKLALYTSSIAEVFEGVTSSQLSYQDAKNEMPGMFEPMTSTETIGYINQGIKVSPALIQFGSLGYDFTSQKGFDLNSNVNLKNDNGGYNSTNSLIQDLNLAMKDLNMKCLLSGGCSASQKEVVKIPKGNFTLPIGYYLPGTTQATSYSSMKIDLQEDIILPF